MQCIQNLDEWQRIRKTIPTSTALGLVPTMGNLHKGHASLVSKCQKENTITVVSLFINPMQFNQRDDFNQYPRTLDADLALLTELGVDYCLLPDEKNMYPDGYAYQIQENKWSNIMEGKQRPGHFEGVLTIVMKLLQLVKPQRAYFGKKDYQQYLLIRDMVAAFFMDIEIIPCKTIREPSGLAYSSRNNRLNTLERQSAEQFARIFHQLKSPSSLSAELKTAGIIVEYIEEHENRRFAAVTIGNVRLIDNYAL